MRESRKLGEAGSQRRGDLPDAPPIAPKALGNIQDDADGDEVNPFKDGALGGRPLEDWADLGSRFEGGIALLGSGSPGLSGFAQGQDHCLERRQGRKAQGATSALGGGGLVGEEPQDLGEV